MGHKVNPNGMRIGINRGWNSRWFANDKEFATFLNEDIKVRNYLTKSCKDALVSHIEIERSKKDNGQDVKVMIFVARPGVVIGQDGANINRLKKEVGRLLKGSSLRLDVVEVKQPDLDAQLVAQWIATELENRASFRTAQKKAIQRVRKAGGKGCKTLISGRLGGADIARAEGYKEGTIALSTLRTDVDFAKAEAVTAYGRLGVKVWISKPEPKKESSEAVKGE